jgi:peptidoglycan/LPS O-acetylase OafA/YrhL
MNWNPLGKIDSDLYRGIAILMIVTHNFMHLFPEPRENEFCFSPQFFINFLILLRNEPENFARGFLSFFGHFGVQLFIYLSAYGLTKKYASLKLYYWIFIWERLIKIYPSFILSILFWAILVGLPSGLFGPLYVVLSNLNSLALKLTFIANFIPEQGLALVGPWWFISFIFQFYLIFPLLLKLYDKWKGPVLLLISIISTGVAIGIQGQINGINIYLTILGHLPEFCLGIYIAKNDYAGLRVSKVMLFFALIVFILGNIYQIFWYFNHISFLIIFLSILNYFIKKIKENRIVQPFLLFFGALSMPLFLVNGFLREPYISWAIRYNNWLLTIVLCLLFLMISVVVALVLSKMEKRLMSSMALS